MRIETLGKKCDRILLRIVQYAHFDARLQCGRQSELPDVQVRNVDTAIIGSDLSTHPRGRQS